MPLDMLWLPWRQRWEPNRSLLPAHVLLADARDTVRHRHGVTAEGLAQLLV